MQQREPTDETQSLINPCTNYLVSTLDRPKNINDDLLIWK